MICREASGDTVENEDIGIVTAFRAIEAAIELLNAGKRKPNGPERLIADKIDRLVAPINATDVRVGEIRRSERPASRKGSLPSAGLVPAQRLTSRTCMSGTGHQDAAVLLLSPRCLAGARIL